MPDPVVIIICIGIGIAGAAKMIAIHLGPRAGSTRSVQHLRAVDRFLTTGVGAIFIGVGFELEPLIASVGSEPGAEALYRLQEFPLETLLEIAVSAIVFGFPVSIISVILAARYKNNLSRLLISCLSISVLLIIIDSANHLALFIRDSAEYRATHSLLRYLFSVFSDIIGGSITGTAIFLILFRIERYIALRRNRTRFSRNILLVGGGISLSVLIGTFLCLATFYFLTIYRIPEEVLLRVKNWEKLCLVYAEPFFAKVPLDDPATNFRLQFVAHHLEVSVRPQDGPIEVNLCADEVDCPTLSVVFGRIDAEYLEGLEEKELIEHAIPSRPTVNETVLAGVTKIWILGEVQAAHLGLVSDDKKELFGTVYLPHRSTVSLSKIRYGWSSVIDLLEIPTDVKKSFGLDAVARQGEMSISGSVTSPLLLAISPRGHAENWLLSDTRRDAIRNVVSNIEIKIELLDGTQQTFSGMNVGMNSGAKEDNVQVPLLQLIQIAGKRAGFTIANARRVMMREPKFSLLRGAVFPAEVTLLASDSLDGVLKVKNEERPVEEGDKLFLGGAELVLRDEDGGSLRWAGQSRHISINGEIVNDTVLTALPTEVIAVIIASIVSWVLGTYSERRRRSARRDA